MAPRALVIAIEDYPNVQGGGIARTLPGTLQAGLDFKAWLEQKWAAEGKTGQLIFCSEPKQPDGRGATSIDIMRALLELAREGRDTTEELYVYFSGHGFSFVEKIAGPANRADVAIASDFIEAALSGSACLNLDEIIAWLRAHLGAGRHYYFIDACRNKLSAAQIQRPGGAPPWNPQASGEASSYLLQSTTDGDIAEVSRHFPAAVLAGLGGKGRAKVSDPRAPGAMLVRYDSLRSYVKTAVPRGKLDGRIEGADDLDTAILATLRPAPKSRVTLALEGATPQDRGEIVIKHWRVSTPERHAWTGPATDVEVDPDDYSVAIELGDGALAQCDLPMPVDLYDSTTLNFRKVSAGSGLEALPAGPAPLELPGTDVNVVVPDGTAMVLRHVDTGTEELFQTSRHARLRGGRYLATLQGADRSVLKRQDVALPSGAPLVIDPAQWRNSVPHAAIAERLPQYGGGVDFSESLGGPVADPDLNVWLALLGGGRILGSTGDYSKLAGFPLHDFSGEVAGSSPIFVLAGFEDETPLRIRLHQPGLEPWRVARKAMPGIQEHYLGAAPGSQLVSFRVGDGLPYSVASVTTANRATLITLTVDEDGNLRLAQFLLPIGHLIDKLPAGARDLMAGRNYLRDVRVQAQAYRSFRKRRDVAREVPDFWLSDMLMAKCTDPIGASLAIYELLRRGRTDDLDVAVDNMTRFFGDLPDTAAIRRLAGQHAAPQGTPLFLDGLRAFPDCAEWLPLPASHLDYTSPWTAWRAAVA